MGWQADELRRQRTSRIRFSAAARSHRTSSTWLAAPSARRPLMTASSAASVPGRADLICLSQLPLQVVAASWLAGASWREAEAARLMAARRSCAPPASAALVQLPPVHRICAGHMSAQQSLAVSRAAGRSNRLCRCLERMDSPPLWLRSDWPAPPMHAASSCRIAAAPHPVRRLDARVSYLG